MNTIVRIVNIIRFLIPGLMLLLIMILYSHGTFYASDEQWDICVSTGHCDFRIDHFYAE